LCVIDADNDREGLPARNWSGRRNLARYLRSAEVMSTRLLSGKANHRLDATDPSSTTEQPLPPTPDPGYNGGMTTILPLTLTRRDVAGDL
jgi:hypothetical protein